MKVNKKLITRETVADQLSAYLRHKLSLANLVDWAESAMMDGEFDPVYSTTIRDVVARIGVADVRAFGLTWEDCEQLLTPVGYPHKSASSLSGFL
jgi:cobyrinic acid a,c-diamide synthase